MGYRAITDAEMAQGQPITAQLLAQLRDNLAGISAGGAVNDYPVNTNAFASGALTASAKMVLASIDGGLKLSGGAVTQAKLGANAVGFNNIKIGYNTVLASSGAIATGAVTSTAGIYILGWLGSCSLGSTQYQCGPGSGETAGNAAQNWLTNGSPETHFWVYERSGLAGAVAQVTWTYITSSPPYHLDGKPVPLFCFGIQRPDGSLRSLMVMDDPPWYAGAPTEYREERPWLRRRRRPDFRGLADPKARAALLRRIREPEPDDFEEFELDAKGKNRDLALHPHPFPDVAAGERVVLIDPVGDVLHDLAELHRSGEAAALVAGGDVVLGDEYTLPEQPPGVTLLRAAWR